jgi:glycosyltransferase involved in cell wall biosynthesis
MKETVDVSLIAANYNNGKYLKEFICSALNSTVLPMELILIDDGSTDNSLEVLEEFKETPFIKVIRFPENRGFTEALNAGIAAAAGKYIMRADPDDLLMPERIQVQFRFMETHPEIDVSGSNAFYIRSSDGSVINKTNFPFEDENIKSAYKRGEHGILHATAIVKKALFEKYHYQKIFPAEDYEIFSRMVRDENTFANLAEPLYKVRVHSGSSTSNLKISTISQTFEFRDQIFGTKTPPLWVFIYYQHIKHYRSYQMADNIIRKYLHLLIASLMYPGKVWRRIQSIFHTSS